MEKRSMRWENLIPVDFDVIQNQFNFISIKNEQVSSLVGISLRIISLCKNNLAIGGTENIWNV